MRIIFFFLSFLPFHHLLYLSLLCFCLFLTPFIWKLPEEKITAWRVSSLCSHTNVSLASCNFYYRHFFFFSCLPEFLFDRLAATGNEVLLWSVYSCLLLLTEDGLFFSQCHSVYGGNAVTHQNTYRLHMTFFSASKMFWRISALVRPAAVDGWTSKHNRSVFLDLYIATRLLTVKLA